MKENTKLIIKFLGKEANLFELERLGEIIEEHKTKKLFDHFVKIHYLLSFSMKKYDVDNAKKSFKESVKKNGRKHFFRRIKKIGIAASIVLLVALTIFISHKNAQTSTINGAKKNIQAGTDRAILTLENGNRIVLEEGREYESDRVRGNGKSLKYYQNDTVDKISYNFLTVPRGGQFQLILPDGTKIWLNSDSKLKYPVNFKKNGPREIELLYGEVFLQVSPSYEHNGAEFNLISSGQSIQVLGTEFNLKSYSDEDLVKTTLLEGSISIQIDDYATVLNPHQQSVYNTESKEIEVQKIDVSQEISWIKGLFAFDTESLQTIMKTLARWYNVDIIFESANLKEFIFTGILERSSSIEDILNHIEASGEGKLKFVIDDRTILIQENIK